MLLTGIITACWIPAVALLSGAMVLGILTGIWGAVAVAVMGPITVSLGATTWTNLRRYRTIQFSIDPEGVYDGQTRTLLSWSEVTAVRLSQDGNGIAVLGQTPHTRANDETVDDRCDAALPAGGRPTKPLILRHFTPSLPNAEQAVRAFAPHVPIDYIPHQELLHLKLSPPRRPIP
jgi:hypothetical protein